MQENGFWNVLCNLATILSRPHCVKLRTATSCNLPILYLQFLQIPRTTDDLHSVSNQRPAHCSANTCWRPCYQRYTSCPTFHGHSVRIRDGLDDLWHGMSVESCVSFTFIASSSSQDLQINCNHRDANLGINKNVLMHFINAQMSEYAGDAMYSPFKLQNLERLTRNWSQFS